MAYELYQVLEVPFQASTDEIKQAYFRLVRKFSPEKDPERFQQIRVAYNTLSDLKARENYDAMQKYGDQIKDLIEQAEKKMQVEEWSSAIPILKQVLILAPKIDVARNLLGLCYIHTENWDFAVKIYIALTKTNPDVAVYWSHLGCAYKLQAECLNDGNFRRVELYDNARECFQQAVELESFNSAPYLDIAETYLDERNYSEAMAWAERAIGADGKADYNDFEALFFICRVHFCSGESQKIEVIAKRIISLLPENTEIRQYAASRFGNIGIEVAKIAAKSANFDMWRAAFQFLKAAKNINPHNSGIKEICAKVEQIVAAIDQYESLSQDYVIIQGFQRLAAFCLADYFDFYDTPQERKSFLNDILTEILASPTCTIFSSLKRIKCYYPAVYGLNIELFHRIEQVACVP
ncbi:J domain-containing protein [Mastigocladopsis repens]|uniref:J domain-containing protein n=1 Tax=Mastigocladopsis repens TaxID=221287 RepID=UPI00030F2DB5|nr:J domain-containing protein [Mastigocladopsis repens]